MNKHQQKTAATERKLLKAARRIFARDGFEAAKIDEIATAAGYTRGAFYAHFKSKEDLFFALLEQQSSLHAEKLCSMIEGGFDDERRLQTLRNYYVKRAADRQWSVLAIEFRLFALRHPRLRARLAERHRSIRTKIRLQGWQQVLPAKVKHFGESKEVKRVLLEVLLNGLVLESAYDPASISAERVETVLGRIFDLMVEDRQL